jgi:penicillin-binding protein 1B
VLSSEGLRIFTTLDPVVQQAAEDALVKTAGYLQGTSPRNAGLQGAILVTSHANGEIVGYVADRDPRFSGFNRILDASRPIGSLMKPAIAITALQNQKATLGTLLDDTGFKLVFDDGREWQPENYDHTEHGPVLLNTALAHSYNLAFARLGIDTGVPEVLATLKALGVERVPEPFPATLLGALNLTPYEVTQLYQNILGGGFAVPLRSIRAVSKADGTLASRYLYKTKQVVSPEIAYLVQHALVSVVREGTARHLYSRIPRDIILGGKTGTTNENRDSWFVGFDGKYLASVWLGKDDNSLTSLTGASGALRVWEDLFVRQGAESWSPVQPESVAWFFVEDGSGKLSAEGCPGAVRLPFISGTEPQERSVCASEGGTIDSIRQWWQGVFE